MRFAGSKQDQRVELNITPLIDVVFLLLIFFMVSTTFERDSKLQIELPEATAKSETTEDQSIVVSIDANGRYQVNGRSLVNAQPDTLRRAIARIRDKRQDVPALVISADAATPHQAVITVMDAAQLLGIDRLSFATRLTPEDAAARTVR
jgi:biopolymer transport protein ExbD